MEIELSTAIPTSSDSSAVEMNEKLFFASNSLLFSNKNGNNKFIAQVDGTIVDFYTTNSFQIIATADKIFMMQNSQKVGNLKRSVNCVTGNRELFAFGTKNNILEVWNVPKKYKFNLFDRIAKFTGFNGEIISVKLRNEQIISICSDCIVRKHEIRTNTTKILWKSRSAPIFANFYENGAVFVNKHSLIFLESDFSTHEIKKFENQIIFADSYENILVIISLNSNSEKEITLIKEQKTIYSQLLEIKEIITAISLQNYTLAIKTKNKIFIRDLQINLLLDSVELPSITGFGNQKDVICIACDNKKVQIYQNDQFLAEMSDENFRGKICGVFIRNVSCISVSDVGYVSLFNYKDKINYKSFNIEKEISKAEMSEDGSFLMAGNECEIFIVNLQTGKIVETVEFKGIIDFKYNKGFLYILDIFNKLTKYGVFNEGQEIFQLEKQATAFQVKNNKLAVSTEKECLIFDCNFKFIESFPINLEGRSVDEIYKKNKTISFIDFNSLFFCVAGNSNFVKIFNLGFCFEFQLSANRDFDNIKKILGKEKESFRDKIACLKIVVEQDKIFALTAEGLLVFKEKTLSYNPVEFSIETTPEFIKNTDNDLHALIAALKLSNYEILKELFKRLKRIDQLIQFIPESCVQKLIDFLNIELECDYNLKYRFKILHYLKIVNTTFKDTNLDIKMPADLKFAIENIYMLKILKKIQ
ncbi:hypothetical protein NUSPORA_00548 [Nucleospora cyclopteri]